MRALVTGCAGFIGSHLTEALLSRGDLVLGVDCFNDNYGRRDKLANLSHVRSWDDFEFIPIDLARGALDDLLMECDVTFHLAAEPGVRASWGQRFETYVRNNVLATQHLLEAARRWPEKRFVMASSSSIYGQAEALPTREDVLPHPLSPYGTTKLAAEHLCQLYSGNFGVQTAALRLFSVYGPRQRPDMAFNRFCRAAITGTPITVYGDGLQTRDFTYVSDVVEATIAAADAQAASGRIYNIGGGSRVTLQTAIASIERISGRPLQVDHRESQHGDVKDTGADIGAARRDLGYIPAVRLEDGLRAQLDWTAEVLSSRAPP